MTVDLKTMAFFITSMIAIYWLARSVMIAEIDDLDEFLSDPEVGILDKALADLIQMED
jgi:hypothetical protein